jgi:hypothetical protein
VSHPFRLARESFIDLPHLIFPEHLQLHMSRHNWIDPFLTFFWNREKIIDSLALSLLDEMQTVHIVVLEPVSCQEHLVTKIRELMVVLRVVSSHCCCVPEFF